MAMNSTCHTISEMLGSSVPTILVTDCMVYVNIIKSNKRAILILGFQSQIIGKLHIYIMQWIIPMLLNC